MRFNIFKIIRDYEKNIIQDGIDYREKLEGSVIDNGIDWAIKEIVLNEGTYSKYAFDLKRAVKKVEFDIKHQKGLRGEFDYHE